MVDSKHTNQSFVATDITILNGLQFQMFWYLSGLDLSNRIILGAYRLRSL